jgi:hypothetical protein
MVGLRIYQHPGIYQAAANLLRTASFLELKALNLCSVRYAYTSVTYMCISFVLFPAITVQVKHVNKI